MKKIVKNILFMLIIWIVIFAVLNFLSGFITKNTYVHMDPINAKTARTTYGYFAPDQNKKLLFPGLKPYTVTTNSYGLRSVGNDEELFREMNDDTYRVLCVGDSITFGLFVDDKDSYPYRLRGLLTKNGLNAVVFNAGVGSSTVSDCLYYLKRKGLELKPDLVILNFAPNDVDEIEKTVPLYEKMIKENKFSIFKTIKLMKLLRAFRKFEVDYKYHRYLMKIDDKKAKSILVNENKDLENVLYAEEFQRGGMVLDPYNEIYMENWDKYLKSLNELIDLIRNEKIDFICVIYPNILTLFNRTNGDYQGILAKFFKVKGVEYIDLTPKFRKKRGEYLKLYNNPPRDYHLSGYGNQILAEDIYDKLQKEGKLKRK